MHGQNAGDLRAAREELVRYSARLLADGLAVGSAGNLSVRCGDQVAITPSGIPYHELRAGDMAVIALDGSEVDAALEPSSESPMHLAVYAATTAGAVVHTHSAEVIALSSACDELPAIHYAIMGLGGPVRVAPYVRFGSGELARAATAALAGRRAAILRNHGAISYGRTLGEAYDNALLLEWLARVYRLARSYGEPRILSDAELDEVTAEARRRGYGTRRGGQTGPGQLWRARPWPPARQPPASPSPAQQQPGGRSAGSPCSARTSWTCSGGRSRRSRRARAAPG